MDVRDAIPFVVAVLVAIGALFMIDTGGQLYGLGIVLFAVAVIGGFWAINRYFNEIGGGRH
ncbi:MAG: hypothetical protein ACREF1_16535 [Acetobacteraceae bacterium]